MGTRTDDEMLRWLDWMARRPGGILLHAERGPTNRTGLGLTLGRDLRQAIGEAMFNDREWYEFTSKG
jgi:hypothetical protein